MQYDDSENKTRKVKEKGLRFHQTKTLWPSEYQIRCDSFNSLHKMLARPLYNNGLCVKLSTDFSGFNADRANKLKIFFANLFVYGVVTLRALHKTLTYLFQMFVDPFCECFLLDGVSFI